MCANGRGVLPYEKEISLGRRTGLKGRSMIGGGNCKSDNFLLSKYTKLAYIKKKTLIGAAWQTESARSGGRREQGLETGELELLS